MVKLVDTRRLVTFITGMLLIALLLLPMAYPRTGSSVLVFTEDDPYIVRPFYGLPEVVSPGEELTILVRTSQELNIQGATLYGLNKTYTLNLAEVGGLEVFYPEEGHNYTVQRITATIPDDVEEGLYTLVVEYEGGQAIMPRSVIVGDGPRGHIRVFHITDQHFGAVNKGIPNTYKNTRYIALINTMALLYGVDIVVVTGDQADVGSDMVSHKDYFSQMNQLLVPTIIVPGNHDWAQVATLKSFLDYLYGRYQNSLRYWSFVYGDFVFIGLDTRGVGYPEDFQLDFLNNTLHKYKDKYGIVMMHHPIFNRAGFYKGMAEDNRNELYYSWRELGWDQAKRFFEIMNENKNLIAVMTGHVHRDADAIWSREDGSRVYFITTTTANHGYPDGYYWGAKVVDIYTNGTVSVYIPSDRPYFFTSGSINTERFMVIEHTDKYSTAVTWTIDTEGFEDLDTGEVILVFYMNKTVDPSNYKLYGDVDRVKNVVYYDAGIYHLFIATVNATGKGAITLASYIDKEPPTVEITGMSPKKPRQGKLVTMNIRADDPGWGIKNVTIVIEKPDGTTQELPGLITNTKGVYMAVFKITDPGHYKVKAYAYDFNNNKGESKTIEFDVKPRKRQTQTTTTETQTQTTETTTTTTTTITTTTEATTTTQTQETTQTPTQAKETTEQTKTTTQQPQVEQATKTTQTQQGNEPPAWAIAVMLAAVAALAIFVIKSRT